MSTYTIKTFQEFHTIIQKYNDDTIYRGVSRLSFKLLSKVGREKCTLNYNHKGNYSSLDVYEQTLIQEFQKDALPYIDKSPKSSWEWWAIAQHYGLPTRFLDWTKNPLVAAYFAIEDCNDDEDCIIYVTNKKQFYCDIDFDNYPDPIGIDEIFLYSPPHLNNRIVAQSGIFTVHNQPTIPLDETEIPADKQTCKEEKYKVDSIVIKKEVKKGFKKILSLYGINKSTIYPSLDGVAGYLEWLSLDCI